MIQVDPRAYEPRVTISHPDWRLELRGEYPLVRTGCGEFARTPDLAAAWSCAGTLLLGIVLCVAVAKGLYLLLGVMR